MTSFVSKTFFYTQCSYFTGSSRYASMCILRIFHTISFRSVKAGQHLLTILFLGCDKSCGVYLEFI